MNTSASSKQLAMHTDNIHTQQQASYFREPSSFTTHRHLLVRMSTVAASSQAAETFLPKTVTQFKKPALTHVSRVTQAPKLPIKLQRIRDITRCTLVHASAVCMTEVMVLPVELSTCTSCY